MDDAFVCDMYLTFAHVVPGRLLLDFFMPTQRQHDLVNVSFFKTVLMWVTTQPLTRFM